MTERKPHGMGFESWVDKQIREATDRGDFDNLSGAGKPIPGYGRPDDELWWVKGYVEREGLPTETLLPTPLRLRKEIERLPETVRGLPTERAVRDLVAELNRRVVEWLRIPEGPRVPVRTADPDEVVRRWREERQAPPPIAEQEPTPATERRAGTEGAPTKRGTVEGKSWWRWWRARG